MESLQARFFESVTKNRAEVLPELLDHQNLSAKEGLWVYQQAYRLRLKDFLLADYPQTIECLRQMEVNSILDEYINLHPPCSKHPDEFPFAFPQMLKTLPLSFWRAEWEFVPVLALLELNLVLARHTEPLRPFTIGAEAGKSPDDWSAARFQLHSSVFVAAAPWDILELYETPHAQLKMGKNNYYLICQHLNEGPVLKDIDEMEYHLMACLKDQHSLESISRKFADLAFDPQEISSMVARWCREGLIVGVDFLEN